MRDGTGRRMELLFDATLANMYTSSPQKIRVLSEHWVSKQVYCPNCGSQHIERYDNNSQVADFFCPDCKENYELKSQRRKFGPRVVDGAYKAMIERLNGNRNPNLFLLSYGLERHAVLDLLIIPKHFLTIDIIQKRTPLSVSARRAGWVGCNILLEGIPRAGRIFLIKDQVIEPRADVLAKWKRTLFLREQRGIEAKGWLLNVMRCVENIRRRSFSLDDVYRYESLLQGIYPGNNHVREKIRQQLQVLRDKGYLEFVGKGTYQLVDDGN
jgi:type II restriction enzyme